MGTIFVLMLVALTLELVLGTAVSSTHKRMSPPSWRSARWSQTSELLKGKSYFHKATWNTAVADMHQFLESRKGGFLPWL